MNRQKEPLYRKVNTRARGVHHHSGSDARHDRNTKNGLNRTMKRGVQRGLDYTPLYRFLLSRIGQVWSSVYKEIVPRIAETSPIYHIVNINITKEEIKNEKRNGWILVGESSIWSELFIDENRILQKVNPDLKNEDLSPFCSCCTFTFNGKLLTKKYKSENHE